MKSNDDERIKNAIDKTFAVLGTIENWLNLWVFLWFSPARLHWLFLYLISINKWSLDTLSQGVRWSFYYPKVHPDLSVKNSVRQFLAALPDLRKR